VLESASSGQNHTNRFEGQPRYVISGRRIGLIYFDQALRAPLLSTAHEEKQVKSWRYLFGMVPCFGWFNKRFGFLLSTPAHFPNN